MLELCTPVIFANVKILSFIKKTLELSAPLHGIDKIDQLVIGKINVLNVWREGVDLNFGKNDDAVGKYAIKSFTAATKALKENQIDVLVTAPASLTLVDNLQYREFSGYVGVDPLDYVIGIAPAAGSPVLVSYIAPLQTLNTAGAAITVLASGFLTPENNSGGAPFGLYYTTALGGALQPLPISTGIAQAESTTSFVLAPNPTDGLIRLETSNTATSMVRVMDLNGKVILQQNVQGQTSTLDLSALESGMYLVELSNTQGRQIQRIAVR